MAEIPSGPTEPLDVRRIHYLAQLMKRFDLSSVDLSDGQVQIRLRRRGAEIASHAPVTQAAAGAFQPVQQMIPAAPQGFVETAPAPAPADKTIVIESPMVGTYYTSRAPDAPPLVTAGASIHPATIVCIIEAMKVFTDIPAGVSGTVVEVLAKNGQAVEYGQPLFRVKPA
jgi:acetyl-CoA carboxylase biotin carboxyl carrier protein